VAHKLEARIAGEVIDIALVTSEQVIDAQHFVAALEKPVDQVRTEEVSPTRYKPAPRPERPLCHSVPLACCRPIRSQDGCNDA